MSPLDISVAGIAGCGWKVANMATNPAAKIAAIIAITVGEVCIGLLISLIAVDISGTTLPHLQRRV
jgi:hypothetical protein